MLAALDSRSPSDVDPENDTPAALKKYATRMKANSAWIFLTGSKEHVDAPLTFDRTHHHATNVIRILRYDLEKKTLVPVE